MPQLVLLLVACTGAAPDTAADTAVAGPCAEGPQVTWAWADGFFTTWCRSCHSAHTPDRRGAPEGIDFDSEADVHALAGTVRNAVLVAGTMPIGGGVYPDDLALLDRYLACAAGAP